jgi:small subunit ribosomal protein S20
LANTKSAQKQIRAAHKRQLRNKSVRSQSKTMVRKAEELIFSGQADKAEAAVKTAVSSLDKAAGKGILHLNNAARRKSRLVKKLNQLKAEPPAEPTAS